MLNRFIKQKTKIKQNKTFSVPKGIHTMYFWNSSSKSLLKSGIELEDNVNTPSDTNCRNKLYLQTYLLENEKTNL